MTTNYHITKNALEVRVPGTTDIDDCGTMDFHFDLHGSPTTNRQGHNKTQGMPVEGVEKTQGQLPLEKEEKRQISMEPSDIDNFDLHGFQTNRLDLNKPQGMSVEEIVKSKVRISSDGEEKDEMSKTLEGPTEETIEASEISGCSGVLESPSITMPSSNTNEVLTNIHLVSRLAETKQYRVASSPDFIDNHFSQEKMSNHSPHQLSNKNPNENKIKIPPSPVFSANTPANASKETKINSHDHNRAVDFEGKVVSSAPSKYPFMDITRYPHFFTMEENFDLMNQRLVYENQNLNRYFYEDKEFSISKLKEFESARTNTINVLKSKFHDLGRKSQDGMNQKVRSKIAKLFKPCLDGLQIAARMHKRHMANEMCKIKVIGKVASSKDEEEIEEES